MQFAALPGARISIHALREEGDRDFGVSELDYIQFLSTPSVRRATYYTACVWLCQFDISIHALREEGDPTMQPSRSWSAPDFYPRPP